MNFQLAAIGFRPGNDQELYTLLSVAAERSRPVWGTPGGEQHRLWLDGSGAGIAVHLEKRRLVCMTPWFESGTVWPVEAEGELIDTETVHWSGGRFRINAPAGSVSGVIVQLREFGPFRPALKAGTRFDLKMAVMGGDVRIFPGEQEFHAAQHEFWGPNERGEAFDLPPDFLLPTGSLGESGAPLRLSDVASALIAGRIVEHRTLINSLTGRRFEWVRIQAAGLPVETVFWKSRDGTAPEPGRIALVHGWLAGKPEGVNEVEPGRPGFWKKVAGRWL